MFMYDGVFSLMFFLVFGIIIAMFVVTIVKGIAEWSKNNNSPKLTVPAIIVSRRQDVRHSHNDNHSSSYTNYYVTFQVESGDRMEFSVKDSEYGLLAEGDQGNLTFQGTRYLGFNRM